MLFQPCPQTVPSPQLLKQMHGKPYFTIYIVYVSLPRDKKYIVNCLKSLFFQCDKQIYSLHVQKEPFNYAAIQSQKAVTPYFTESSP